jgi:hypothetical protein
VEEKMPRGVPNNSTRGRGTVVLEDGPRKPTPIQLTKPQRLPSEGYWTDTAVSEQPETDLRDALIKAQESLLEAGRALDGVIQRMEEAA